VLAASVVFDHDKAPRMAGLAEWGGAGVRCEL
jgi:hypothetical protein